MKLESSSLTVFILLRSFFPYFSVTISSSWKSLKDKNEY